MRMAPSPHEGLLQIVTRARTKRQRRTTAQTNHMDTRTPFLSMVRAQRESTGAFVSTSGFATSNSCRLISTDHRVLHEVAAPFRATRSSSSMGRVCWVFQTTFFNNAGAGVPTRRRHVSTPWRHHRQNFPYHWSCRSQSRVGTVHYWPISLLLCTRSWI